MQYKEAVAEARTLVKRSEDDQWRLAQLTWEQVQAGRSRAQWARDIGMSESAVAKWYSVWKRYRDTGSRPRWADAWNEELGRAGRADDAGSQYQAQAQQAIRNMPTERRARVVRDLLTDPDVAHETFNAPEPDDQTAARARMHAGSAISRHDQRIQDHYQEKRPREAAEHGRSDQEALYEVSTMMQTLASVVVDGGKLARKLSDGATLSPGTRMALASYATKAKATIEWLEGIKDADRAEDIDEVLRVWAAES